MFNRILARNTAPDARLEYAAMLSGLSMAGDDVSSTMLEAIKTQYIQRISDATPVAAPAKPSKR